MAPDPVVSATREALRALACYVVAPARKARTGRIGLRATLEGFATPPFDDGTRIEVWGDRLSQMPDGPTTSITTLREAASFLGVALSDDPGVGHDLPPFRPDEPLAVDPAASLALGRWWGLGDRVLRRLEGAPEAQLWPEHFDLATTVQVGGMGVNVGFSPGDAHIDEPYVYVGPHDMSRVAGPFWNMPWGAARRAADLGPGPPFEEATQFIADGLADAHP